MPPRNVYSLNFMHGNLTPVTSQNWGDMVPGGSTNGVRSTQATSKGRRLYIMRDADQTAGVMNSLWVLPPEGSLPLESRLRMTVTFDMPHAEPLPGGSLPPESWAVALRLKFAQEIDTEQDADINVTCRFQRSGDMSGVLLNSQAAEQRDPAAYLDSPLDYSNYFPGCLGFGRAPRFTLGFDFCGVQAGPVPSGPVVSGDPLGYAVGAGSLTIDHRSDQRVFSNIGLSSGAQAWIGALGISLATLTGIGQYRVRLLGFNVYLW